MNLRNKREMLGQKIKAEVDLDRLTDLLANDYLMQQAAQELKESVEDAERGQAWQKARLKEKTL